MKEIIETLDRWQARGDRIALATVVATRRSAPRPPGTKMAINEHSEIVGAVSGGCVEGAVAVAALEVLESGQPRLLEYGIDDDEAWGVGLPCGGEIEIWLEPYA
jgi:xanthine dehydrogenase accessory factor